MGYEVKLTLLAGLFGLVAVAPAAAQDAAADAGSKSAIGVDFFASTDADKTDVYRAGLNLDIRYRDQRDYLGVRLEKAWYRPLGLATIGKERGFLRCADSSGRWGWNAQVGSDRDNIVGAATI